ncbi:MAG TPA: zinc ribbon domain-containing protein [Lachnospiraceae bacterium]|nr:zinc ribbon domain-containing protein [Lachnospiraceae bacterium]
MFFIMGISQKEKKLNYDKLVICKCCGKYGHVEVFMTYSYFMFFFIPLFKWNRHYFIRMNCCGSTCELNTELGRAIEQGADVVINPDNMNFTGRENRVKHCSYCGYTTMEDFEFCPKCGKSFNS